MKKRERVNIVLENCCGVSRVGEDSKLLAFHATNQKGKTALDVGTGTGIVAIKLQARGWKCMGVDFNPAAVECARKNAQITGMKIVFKESNLFESVSGKFDLVVFNPPYGSTAKSNGLLEFIKYLLPRENLFISRIIYFLIKKQRRQLIRFFLNQVGDYLNENGRVMMVLHKSEIRIFKSWKIKVLDKCKDCRIVLMKKR